MLLVVVAVMVVPIGALAQNGSPYGQRHTVSDRTAAAAALLPVDEGSEGWGRVMVADRTHSEEITRDLVCHLFEMDAETEYTLMIDDIEVGKIVTDLEGEGWLHLQTPERTYPVVPEGLPAVADLLNARVLDGVLAIVLEGELLDMPSPPAGAPELVYLEKARLVTFLEDGTARGQARVARDVDEIQYFQTIGIRVEPNTSFRVEVDGQLAGTVTSNAGGVAELKLSTGDFGDALPNPLQPIEDLRLVEWFSNDDDSLALSGTFAGQNQMGFGGPGGGGHSHGGDNGECDGDWDGDGGDGGNGDCDGDCDGEGGNGDGGNGGGGGGDHGGGSGDGSGDGDCDGSGGGNP